ncbi:MAG: DUF5789 family protein [Halobacteriota archaeon]|uniref:DUF5789 family protein n=1 Tax=Halanaeroarchaeum sp. HSR-CO TaxID=2866382 RepID=UPI00217E5883|nr:hypothetical protein [Halanaeroarchaeum sp. HSR-CO]UWG48402.1 Uncharacterized protein HSRCO_2130 [Halanaeroarchaeum sp. HSR-CO]
MRLPETRDLFARELTFPTSHRTVIEAIGETELQAPTGQSESIEEVLDRTSNEQYRSADELYDALMTFVSDEFIGRKFYDDRGSTPKGEGEEEEVF